MAIKLAVAKGADVYAFTTSVDKVKDIFEVRRKLFNRFGYSPAHGRSIWHFFIFPPGAFNGSDSASQGQLSQLSQALTRAQQAY